MMMKQFFGIVAFAAIALILMPIPSSSACMCMPKHSQSSYCDSEYVILARILRKSNRRINHNNVYKIEVKKAYKKSAKADAFLREGRLLVPAMDSMCGGVNLKIGKLYLIASNSQVIDICNFVKEYSEMTIVERRGFAGAYKKGCSCTIKPMFQIAGFHQEIGACNWQPSSECQTNFGSCIPARGFHGADKKPLKCHWRNSIPYNACVSNAQQAEARRFLQIENRF